MMMRESKSAYDQPRMTAYGIGVLLAGGGFAAIVLGVTVFLLAQAFAAAPVVSAMFSLFAVIGATSAAGVVVRQQRAHARQLADVHKAVAAGATAAVQNAMVSLLRNAETPATVVGVPFSPPQRQLAAPKSIRVPRSTVMNRAVPFGLAAATNIPILETESDPDETGARERLAVPLNYLIRFAALATPTRNEWVGERARYADCAAWFVAQGMLDQTANGGFAWRREYPAESRRAWLTQFEDTTS